MSMETCSACDQQKDSDFIEFEYLLGKPVCESCLAAIPEASGATPRSALFRLGAACAIAEYLTDDCAPEGTAEIEYPTHAEQMADL